MKRVSLVLLAAVFAGSALADEGFLYRCQKEGGERLIEVRYPTGEALPCEVHYTKYGASERIWSAQNTQGYCQHKAFEFANKQQGWGWECFRENPGEAPVALTATE